MNFINHSEIRQNKETDSVNTMNLAKQHSTSKYSQNHRNTSSYKTLKRFAKEIKQTYIGQSQIEDYCISNP